MIAVRATDYIWETVDCCKLPFNGGLLKVSVKKKNNSLYLGDILIIPSYISDTTQFRDDWKKPVQSVKNPLPNTTELSVPMRIDLLRIA